MTAPSCARTLDLGQSGAEAWRDIRAVAGGFFHVVGLRGDGTVAAAGINMSGQCDVAEWRNIIAIAAGDYFTAGLTSDGRIVTTSSTGDAYPQVSFELESWRDIVRLTAGGCAVMAVGENSDCRASCCKDRLDEWLLPPGSGAVYWTPEPVPTYKPGLTPASVPFGDPPVFDRHDANCGGICLDWRIEEVEAVLGVPPEASLECQPAFGRESVLSKYDGLRVSFDYLRDDIWTAASIYTARPGDEGPRGIRVGDPAGRVIEAFYSEPFKREGNTRKLYEIDTNDGWIEYGQSDEIVEINYRTGGGFGMCFLSFDIGNGVVTGIYVFVMNI